MVIKYEHAAVAWPERAGITLDEAVGERASQRHEPLSIGGIGLSGVEVVWISPSPNMPDVQL
jgi:hypothetical protein